MPFVAIASDSDTLLAGNRVLWSDDYLRGTWRSRRIAAGMPFRHPPAPRGWDPQTQLRAAKRTDRS